jgi:hypothetical protein
MWKLPKPTRASREAFCLCISRVKDAELKARFLAIEGDVVNASDAFEVAAGSVALCSLPLVDNVGGLVTKEEMSALYTSRMAKKDAPGRVIYDELLSALPYGRCPLCGQRTVSTLDHHLPKSLYPALAVTPANLVPACLDCNKAKFETAPKSSEEETLHPYFDDIEDDLWLHAEVIKTAPAALRFFVDPPNYWNSIMIARAHRHFQLLKLSQLYASHAAVELTNIQRYLQNLLVSAGVDSVREHLQSRALSCEQARTNSWQTAAYTALAASSWYCEGGFV